MRQRLDPEQRGAGFPGLLCDDLLPRRAEYFQLEGRARCAELGPSPLSPLAWAADRDLLGVTAVDALADERNALPDEQGIDSPVGTTSPTAASSSCSTT